MNHFQYSKLKGWFRSPFGVILLLSVVAGTLLLFSGHKAHLLGILPYVLLLLCPLFHLFGHGRHGHKH